MAMMFGSQDDLNCIVDISLQGASSEQLCLGFRVSMTFFIGGVWTSDEGYVLKVKNEKSYYPMPSGDELKEYQANGMIPSPLPSYSVPLWDYAFGFSLWIILGVMGAFAGIKHALHKRRVAKLEAAT
ncbi:MAG: hypothetical protein IPQ07_13845 [Myxococcales bacterium]|nr:hypothetical protein [Myxococcales bacterium]